MHVKYASRHALYPVPNVFEPAADAVNNAARDRRDVLFVAARDVVPPVVVAVRARDVAVRDVFVGVARDVVAARGDCVVVDVVRGDTVLVRDVAVRDVVVRGVCTVPAVVRDCVVVVADVVRDCCVVVDAERTAALAKPMPPHSTAMNITTRFIIVMPNDIKI